MISRICELSSNTFIWFSCLFSAFCDAGRQGSATNQCELCPFGTYKATAGFGSCVDCPLNTVSTSDRTDCIGMIYRFLYEPRCEKTRLRGFQPGPTQTGLYSHRRWLET